MRLPASIAQGILARAALVFLRIFLGLVFLLSAWGKLQSGAPPILSGILVEAPHDTGHPVYREFLQRVAGSDLGGAGAAITWVQGLVGITLVLGVLTRVSAVLALVLAVHSMLAGGSVQDAGYAAIAIALLVGAAGRTMGFDGMLARRWPRSPLW